MRIAIAVLIGMAAGGSIPPVHAAIDKTYEQLKLLVDILDYIQENYVDEVKSKDLIYGAAGGMVKTLDPFSQFMDPDLHKEIKTETEGQFGGLGIRIGMREEWLAVITPLPGTPAYRIGVLPGDRIIKIDDETTKGLTLIEAVKKLRGKPGTDVKITIARQDGEEGKPKDKDKDKVEWTTKDFTITREIIKIESVRSHVLDNKIGYVQVIEFTAHTSEDTREAIEKLKKAGSTSLVLDLRNNPGGLLTSAVEVASFFLGGNKLVVYTQGRHPESRQDFRSGAKAPYESTPMVVLINGGSASGSEIVAGALQDQRRAVIVGGRSFGKASVQSVIPLSDGSGLRLTVAKYYTPLGRSIQRDEKKDTGGIMPDIDIPVSHETEAKLQTQAEQVFEQGKDAKSIVKDEEKVKDLVLERAIELLKAREILGTLNVTDG